MIGSDTLTLFPGSQTLLGKQVSDMVGNDLKVYQSGEVVGTFHYVTGFTGFRASRRSKPDITFRSTSPNLEQNDIQEKWDTHKAGYRIRSRHHIQGVAE